MLSILSWNIRQGGGRRTAQIVDLIDSVKAYIVILSEYRNNDRGEHLTMLMRAKGYIHMYAPPEDKTKNSVAIFSKMEGKPEVHHDADTIYPYNIMSVHFDAFSVCGVYLPHKKKHKLIPYITELGNKHNYIVAGDYNTGKNFIDQKGKTFWYTDELLKFEQSGYIDAFRHIHGDVSEFSWYSYHGNGFRYDHTYVHEDLLPIAKECYYIHEWREDKASDHSPMMLKLG